MLLLLLLLLSRFSRVRLCATPRPWDSLGKNTGVGCHVLLQCMKVKSESEVAELLQNRATLQVDPSPPGSLGRQDTGLEGSKRYPGSGYYGPA